MAVKKYVGETALEEVVVKTKELLGNKVDKEQGKGLSTNDYTTAEKEKLVGIANGAQVNVLEGVQVNGTDLTIVGKKVNLDLSAFITKNVDDLVNYYTKTETYTKSEVASLIGALKTIQIEVVQALPATGESNIIYLVSHSHGTGDVYDEYIWVSSENSFEKIGNTDIDLSNYPTTAQMNAAIAAALAAYYSKSDIDTLLAAKLNAADLVEITASEVDALFAD